MSENQTLFHDEVQGAGILNPSEIAMAINRNIWLSADVSENQIIENTVEETPVYSWRKLIFIKLQMLNPIKKIRLLTENPMR